ncbi:MAG: hypothetical protein LUE99_03635 [Bacteroides sp.]|nr:hypothetical protein [Bacteroides sp.]
MAVLTALPLLLSSCERGGSEPVPADGQFVFRLTLPPALSVNTRAGDIGGTSVNDVWVVQFDENGKKIAAQNFGEGVIKQGDNAALLIVTTDGFSNINSTFRVIGNFGSDQTDLVAFSASSNTNVFIKDLQKITIPYTGYKTNRNLLVSNDIKYESKSGNADKAVIIAPLNFAYAWIDVKWTNKVVAPAKFTLNSINAYKLPTTLAMDTRVELFRVSIRPLPEAIIRWP